MEELKLCEGCGVATQLKHFQRKKTCNNCRRIKPETFEKVKEEFLRKFENEFNLNTDDELSSEVLTLDEEIEKHYKLMNFCKKQLPCANLKDIKDENEIAKWIYVQEKMRYSRKYIEEVEKEIWKNIMK